MPNLDDVFNRYIGRIVAFVLAPILVPGTAIVAAWAQDALGLDLDEASLTAFVASIVLGLSALAWQWLRGNSVWERAVVETHALYTAGTELAASDDTDEDSDPDPVTPPGVVSARDAA